MKKFTFIFLSFILIFSACDNKPTIIGSGSSFAYPVYNLWSYEFSKYQINYQSTGSGAGQSQIKQKVIDFGGSDEQLTNEELNKFNLIQFPTLISGIVLSFNLPNINSLRLNPEVLSKIYLGKITEWNDNKIKELNPNIDLPNVHIQTIHRADSSGTTLIFTKYLSDISSEWNDKFKYGKSIQWINGIGAKGNEGVSVNIQQIKGSIGYVEYYYSLSNNLKIISLFNKDENFVLPNIESFKSSSNYFAIDENGLINTVNMKGENSWPITGITFVLLRKDNVKNNMIKEFFKWGMIENNKPIEEMGYLVYPKIEF